jgi:hypothetical protein
VDLQEVEQVPEGMAQEAHRVADELGRRVDLVGDAGGQTADGFQVASVRVHLPG